MQEKRAHGMILMVLTGIVCKLPRARLPDLTCKDTAVVWFTWAGAGGFDGVKCRGFPRFWPRRPRLATTPSPTPPHGML